jgi:hypothetical protein
MEAFDWRSRKRDPSCEFRIDRSRRIIPWSISVFVTLKRWTMVARTKTVVDER